MKTLLSIIDLTNEENILMKKLIDIPEKDNLYENLQILAIKAKKPVKIYMQDVLIEHVKKSVGKK